MRLSAHRNELLSHVTVSLHNTRNSKHLAHILTATFALCSCSASSGRPSSQISIKDTVSIKAIAGADKVLIFEILYNEICSRYLRLVCKG